MNREYTLFLDMDGVLVDFEGGFKKLSDGLKSTEMKDKYGEKIVKDYFLNAGINFWADLDWVMGGRELWNTSIKLFERVCILSSSGTTDPEKGKIVEAGKRLWLKKNIPSIQQDHVFIVGGRHLKQKFAGKLRILVDDMPETISQWNDVGGYGILHYHEEYKKTIGDLQDIAMPLSLMEIKKRYIS